MTATRNLKRAAALVALTVLLAGAGSLLLWVPPAGAAAAGTTVVPGGVMQWGLIAAAAATGLSSLAAGYAVAGVGSAGMGTLAERPELFGRVLVLMGLAEGIAIYGLIISILILNRLG
ncbi:MAG TPA: ATP synthase subunit C [Gammaproteobacteria bacterium]|nr:ATP synthase subunit C [Gammaproteobacteria bacterium]